VPLFALVALQLALSLPGIRFGLPNVYSWAPDEVIPAQVLEGLDARFANGWWNPYPPFHFAVISAAYAPVRLLGEPARVAADSKTYERYFLAGRLVSVALGTGIVLLLHACGRELGDGRAGLFAGLITMLGVTFAYYTKFANFDVPYCFWLALALLFFLRALRTKSVPDVVAFSASATLSVCTKDQAYACFVLPSLLLLRLVARDRKRNGLAAGPLRLLLDPRILGALAAAALLFVLAHNLLFNASGFLAHLGNITGPLGADYRMFEKTAGGQAQLLLLTARHVLFALGLPAVVLCVAGVVLAARDRRSHGRLLCLLAFAASYHAFFSALLLYSYDRFVLPIALPLSLFGGYALSELGKHGSAGRLAQLTAAALVAAVGLTRVIGLDLLLLKDSRYVAEDWLRRNAGGEARVAALGPLEYLPRLHGLDWKQRSELVRAIEHMSPDHVVVNADYAAALEDPRARELYDRLERGDLGYTLSLAHRTKLAWPFQLDGDIRARGASIHSNLVKINPEIRVYTRRAEP
jgi:hypothetical protein